MNYAAQYSLGVLCDTGRGLPQDYPQALQWYLKAAQRGHPLAQLNLANMYDEGHGVPRNLKEAAAWYRKAADQGVPAAEYAIAGCYADGEGVPQDNIEAYKWISLAEAHGATNATIFKNALTQKLTPEQKAKAQQVVDRILADKRK